MDAHEGARALARVLIACERSGATGALEIQSLRRRATFVLRDGTVHAGRLCPPEGAKLWRDPRRGTR